jgi:hypothetical protein
MVQVVEQADAARMVIEHGANLTAQNNDGLHPVSSVNPINLGLRDYAESLT